jgi:2-amino-4-hydroxy-6-hydroxymethyldihydropteridine diphosphokinase
MTHRAYIGVGANAGEAGEAVERAIGALAGIGGVLRRSSLYRTRPWGGVEQPDFVNAVALLETGLAPRDLLAALKALETRLGRVPGERWGPRAIDLDLLTYDDVRLDEPDLSIPHAHLYERAFVLVPLAEIDERYAAARDALAGEELEGVRRL